ncbi:hypothetical protein D3C71_383170 [compost metagenome]
MRNGRGINLNRLERFCEITLDRLDRSYICYIVLILLGMYSLGQLTAPFVAHDDFDWLLSGFDQGFETPLSKAGSEGRWGNVIWAQFSHLLGIRAAFGLYLVSFSLMCVLISRVVSPSAGVFGALLLFLSPMTAETMQWPVTQVTGVVVTVLGCLAMLRVQSDGPRRLVMAISVVSGFLFYPSFGPLFLLMYATRCMGDRRSVVLGGFVYVASFACAVLLVFTLNYIFHGTFSIRPAAWREATPLMHGGTLLGNIERYLGWFSAVKDMWPALIGGALAYLLCFRFRVRAPQCLALVLFGGLLLGIDASLSVVSGLSMPLRSTVWLWLLLCIPVIFLAHERKTIVIGLLLALPLVYTGVTLWAGTYADTRHVYPAMQRTGVEIARAQAENAGRVDDVILFGDVHANKLMGRLHSNRALRNYLYKDFSLYTRQCEETLCAKVQAEIETRAEVPQWLIIDRHLVWVLSPQNSSTY